MAVALIGKNETLRLRKWRLKGLFMSWFTLLFSRSYGLFGVKIIHHFQYWVGP